MKLRLWLGRPPALDPLRETPREEDTGKQGVRELRSHFRRHNREVILLVTLTIFGVVALWSACYAVFYWLSILFLSVSQGLDAKPPERFPAFFLAGAGSLLVATWCLRWFSRGAVLRDEKSALEITTDFVLAIPRATLAIWGNLRALQSLDDSELAIAAAFLQRAVMERGIPVYRLPLDLPDPAAQKKIILGLQLVELLTQRRRGDEMWLVPGPKCDTGKYRSRDEG